MTIKEYYQNYKVNKKYTPSLFDGNDLTIENFYNNCIAKHISDPSYIKNAKQWHNMLLEYVKRDDAVFWIRYYESGSKKSGRWNNRRACRTDFNNLSYVYVSNYDIHEIFNMVRLGVKADAEEFATLMNNYEFPLHYDSGKSCEESDICAYSKIGTVRGGILTKEHWYLAHIVGVKSTPYIKNNSTITIDVDNLYPRGTTKDWNNNSNPGGKIVRKIARELTADEKELVIAHFLRFVDPLNYYVVPGQKSQDNCIKHQIGEAKCLNDYMNNKFEEIFGKKIMDDFKKLTLSPISVHKEDGTTKINIKYGYQVLKSSSSFNKATQNSYPNQNKNPMNSKKRVKYNFNGHEYYKRGIAVAIVEKYVADNPDTTYESLVKTFNIIFSFNRKPWVRLFSDLNADDKKHKRASFENPITLKDGTVVVVNKMVQGKEWDDIIRISSNLGYIISEI